jgi:hypothetical protein
MKRTLAISVCLALAALLHFITTPERFIHAGIAIGLLYILLGITQGTIAILSLLKPQYQWSMIIRYTCAILLALFILNQTASTFIPGIVAEPYSLATISRKLLEIFVLVLSLPTHEIKRTV